MTSDKTSEAQRRSEPVRAASRPDVFLSYNRRDQTVVTRLAEALQRRGIEPWFDLWCTTPGGRWQDELAAGLAASAACAVFVGPSDLGDWEHQELQVALNRAAKEPAFRVFLVLLPGVPEPFDPSRLSPFLSTRSWVDLRQGFETEATLAPLVNAVRGRPLGRRARAGSDGADVPYRGLRAFEEADAELFFGRTADTQRLVEKLKASRCLTVLGASGSGKSSLVRAGLIPALRHGAIAGSDRWVVRVFRPGAHPLEALGAHVLRLDGRGAMRETLTGLASDPHTLHLAVVFALAEHPPEQRVVWVIDQAEELFTLCRDEPERSAFLENLLYAATVPGGRTIVVLTVRADFYARFAAYPQLAQTMASGQALIGALDRDRLRDVIVEPARLHGVGFEPGLVDTILSDVAQEPGALPLLEHALLELWHSRDESRLTLQAYHATGGVAGALAHRADEVFENFTPDQQATVQRILLRLTEPGEGTEDTRRRASLTELVTRRTDDGGVDEVVAAFTDARLLTTGSDQTSGAWVDVAHEALIRGWPRLRRWLDEDRSGLLVARRLSEAAQEWQRLGHDDGALYRGARLAEARAWSHTHEDGLNALERDFLESSAAHERNELQQQRRRLRRQRTLISSVAVVVSVTAGLAIFLIHRTNLADAARYDAELTRRIVTFDSATTAHYSYTRREGGPFVFQFLEVTGAPGVHVVTRTSCAACPRYAGRIGPRGSIHVPALEHRRLAVGALVEVLVTAHGIGKYFNFKLNRTGVDRTDERCRPSGSSIPEERLPQPCPRLT